MSPCATKPSAFPPPNHAEGKWVWLSLAERQRKRRVRRQPAISKIGMVGQGGGSGSVCPTSDRRVLQRGGGGEHPLMGTAVQVKQSCKYVGWQAKARPRGVVSRVPRAVVKV